MIYSVFIQHLTDGHISQCPQCMLKVVNKVYIIKNVLVLSYQPTDQALTGSNEMKFVVMT